MPACQNACIAQVLLNWQFLCDKQDTQTSNEQRAHGPKPCQNTKDNDTHFLICVGTRLFNQSWQFLNSFYYYFFFFLPKPKRFFFGSAPGFSACHSRSGSF